MVWDKLVRGRLEDKYKLQTILVGIFSVSVIMQAWPLSKRIHNDSLWFITASFTPAVAAACTLMSDMLTKRIMQIR